MKTIRNTKLFYELKKSPEWETLWNSNHIPKDDFPTFRGGLDHIEVKKDAIIFHDSGSNLGDNSFRIVPESHIPKEIYLLPCNATALDQEVDNCGWDVTIYTSVEKDVPMLDICWRYCTSDGYFYDMNIDPPDWEIWFGKVIPMGVK